MAAFRRAVEYGLPSEFDVHLIADGSLVIFHEEDLERQTGVKGKIEAYDLTNLRKLRLEGTDEMIPTFDEVLDLYEDTGLPLLINGEKSFRMAAIERFRGHAVACVSLPAAQKREEPIGGQGTLAHRHEGTDVKMGRNIDIAAAGAGELAGDQGRRGL